jgi:hypothetical protein
MTSWDPRLDPSRHPRVSNSKVFSELNFLLLVSVSVFQLWFWFVKVPTVGGNCYPEYGFFFSKILLNKEGIVAANIILHFALLICCIHILWITLGIELGLREEQDRV